MAISSIWLFVVTGEPPVKTLSKPLYIAGTVRRIGVHRFEIRAGRDEPAGSAVAR